MPQPIQTAAEDLISVCQSLANLSDQIQTFIDRLASTLIQNGKLITCGNGGSAAQAMHLATEFVCRFQHDRPPYAGLCLNASGPDLTAIGNDYAFDDLFARQLQAFARPGDLLVALSTSGNSQNICNALTTARELKLPSIALLGKAGGQAANLADLPISIDSQNSVRIQEAHLLIIHEVCRQVDERLATHNAQ